MSDTTRLWSEAKPGEVITTLRLDPLMSESPLVQDFYVAIQVKLVHWTDDSHTGNNGRRLYYVNFYCHVISDAVTLLAFIHHVQHERSYGDCRSRSALGAFFMNHAALQASLDSVPFYQHEADTYNIFYESVKPVQQDGAPYSLKPLYTTAVLTKLTNPAVDWQSRTFLFTIL